MPTGISNFHDLVDELVDPIVDEHFGEDILLMPQQRSPNGRGGDDPDRPQMTVTAVFFYPSAEFGIELGVRRSYREANDLRALQVGREAQITLKRSYFTSVAVEPRQGDYVRFLTRPELPDFEVASAQRDGITRIILKLVHLGAQA